MKKIVKTVKKKTISFFLFKQRLTEWGPNDEVLFTPQNFTISRCHTTVEMFIANILYTPILIKLFSFVMHQRHPLLVLICFPLNIWLAEIVIG